MRSSYRLIAAPLIAVLAMALMPPPPEAKWEFTAATGSVEVEGTSSVHDWTCIAEEFEGSASAVRNETNGLIQSLREVTFRVPVEALECGNGTMNRKTRGALDADEYPAISFVMDEAEVANGEEGLTELNVAGRLTVAGNERPIEMLVQAETMEDGTLKVEGSVPLKMTDFDVKPPTAMLGVLKTGEDVTVHFELLGQPEDAQYPGERTEQKAAEDIDGQEEAGRPNVPETRQHEEEAEQDSQHESGI